jgi:hypothetical protein
VIVRAKFEAILQRTNTSRERSVAELPDARRAKLSQALGAIVTLRGALMLVDTDVLICHRRSAQPSLSAAARARGWHYKEQGP